MRLGVLLSAAMLLLAACGGISAEGSPGPGGRQVQNLDDPPGSAAPSSNDSTTTHSPVPARADIDLIGYVSVIEHMLEGTKYSGDALASPEVFLATGALFCDQLDAGTTADTVLVDYIETLTGGSIDEASDDDLTMAGAVLGSGLATLCPHNIEGIGASE